MGLFAVPMLVDCGGRATCDDLCDNLLDKCAADYGGFNDYEDVARNNCLEQCTERTNAVPEKCALEKDEVLSCLADADSLDCNDAQQSASCATENAALNNCVYGDSNGSGGGGGGGGTNNPGSGGSTSSSPNGQSCLDDGECASGLCSWATDVCITPGEIGETCERDNECVGDLCNWSTEVCSELGGPGAACLRDTECASNSCPDDVCS